MVDGWGKAQTLKLINLFRDYSLIWNKSLDDYRNKDKREQAFEEIGEKIGVSKAIIKRKLHSLRTHYRSELRKVLAKKDYKPAWMYYNSMKFMFKHVDAYCDTSDTVNRSFKIQSSEGFSSKHLPNVPNENIITGNIGVDEESLPERERICNDWEDEVDMLEENEECDVDDTHGTIVFRDEFTVFGEHVANELRLLNGYRSIQLALKCKIMRALLEANEALHRSGWNKSI